MDCDGRPQVRQGSDGLCHARVMEPTVLDACSDEAAITCPRCGQDASERFYGPCAGCRRQLRDHLGGPRREVEVQAYEPKMNVTPNAVALKE